MKVKSLRFRKAISAALFVLLLNAVGLSNALAQTEGALNGVFTINDSGDKVRFSRGNLQYQASTSTWRFATQQYDYVGTDNENISATYGGWIDLFGWGTSGYHNPYDNYNTQYQPYSTSTATVNTSCNTYGYGPSTNMQDSNLTGTSAEYDWGVHNAISNGGNQAGLWRTLTKEEWNYIFKTRTASTVGGTANARFVMSQVNGVNGLILFPDEYTHPSYLPTPLNVNDASGAFNTNSFTGDGWTAMENMGCVFLPAAGFRKGNSTLFNYYYSYNIQTCGTFGLYWSVTHGSNAESYNVAFRSGNLYYCDNTKVKIYGTSSSYYYTYGRFGGYSVRLVCEVGPTVYNIGTSVNPAEGGMVSGGGEYDEGTTCTLTATPNPGYSFINWTENGTVVTTNTSYIFTVTGDRNLVANFSINSYNISASTDPTNGGTVTGTGNYNYGETAILTATPNEGYTFTNWTENGYIVSTNATCSFTVTSNRNLVANFTLNNYYIATLANPIVGGTVTGAGNYNYGTTATLTATANNGYSFLNWTENGNIVSTSANYSFIVTGIRNLVANFNLNTYDISAVANPTAGGTVIGMGTFNYGETATLTVTANEGYTFSCWTENGNIVSAEASYSFTVTGDRSLVANFDIYNHNYSNDYFTLESHVDSNTITLSIPSAINSEKLSSVSYSTDGTTWTTLAIDATNQSISVTLDAGEKVYFKGIGVQYGVLGNGSSLSATGDFIAYGNIMSLLYGDGFVSQTDFPAGSMYAFSGLFYNNTKLVSAENLILPAITLVDYCYYDMFHGCTALNSAPELPATSLAEYCYSCMFSGCTSLSSAPELPATTLVNSCYSAMFTNCTLLSNAPELPATTLASACYADMFNGCTSLSSAPVLPATTMENGCYGNMFSYCTSLSSAPELPATTLAAYCYYYMFAYCTSLSMAPELPATTLAGYCYSHMFVGCTSLNSAPELPATTLAGCCYYSMFAGCTSLSSAPELPATTLSQACYWSMFSSCRSLDIAPELPATTLAGACYSHMFYNCTSLSSAPELPATTLAGSCYYFMFYGCTSLNNAPTLPAVTLASSCYGYMFSGCSSLNEVTCLATDISATKCTENWLKDVAETGTFHKNPEMNDWPLNSASGIPAGWNIDVFSVDITATTNPNEGGTITGAGNYNYGQTCTLNATANEGYTFTSWTKDGEIVSTEPVYSFTVTESATFVANFEEIQVIYYNISASSNPSIGGSVTGAGTYMGGQTCTLTATANEGYTFGSWTENGEMVSTNATYSFEVTGMRTLEANFAELGSITNHWIPVQNFENTMDGIGIVLIDGVEQQSAALELGIFCGEECRGSFLPEEEDGHWLYYFSMGGIEGETFTFRLYNHLIQQELEIACSNEVQFEVNGFLGDWDEPYEFQFSNNVLVTVTINPEGAGEVTGAGEYPHGTTATLSATANTGFAFRDWSINGETVSTEPTLTLTVETPIQVTANFDYVQEYSFSTGWNWWGSYIELSDIDGLTMLEEGLGESGVMIKTNGSYARRRPNNTWFGSLNSINNETGYKIQTSSNCTVVVRGSLADPSDHPISINANGWTWIGYPVQASQSANAALSGFNPENKDMIKGQNGYARYDANSGTWKPSSFTLTPGKSYLYYSNATEAKSLVWNAGRSTFSNPEHHWTPNQTFENTMDGIGIVVIDGEEQFTGDLELGIFCGDDCRGSVFAEDEGDHWFYYFSMGGVSGETFTFRLYNHATQEELDLVCNNEAVPFEINGFLGDWDAPYEIDFTSNSTQTFTLPITGYGNSAGGYYLIAPPVDNVDPAEIEGMTEGDFDLYYFDQAESDEWRNYEAEPFNLESGKGYLYAHKTDVTLAFIGTPYSGNGQVALSKTTGAEFAGWNLVGNPFAQTATIDRDCYVMKADGTEIIASDVRTVSPMQGVFVIAASDGEEMTFVPQGNTDMGARIVLNVSKDRAGVIDRAIVRFGDNGTLPKFMLNPVNTKLYITHDGADYAVMSCSAENTTPVSFKASSNGTYTLGVDLVNLDLDYLHLIDNMTGADVDLLQQPSYTFEAHTFDYTGRFNLVYVATSNVNEAERPFAYYVDGEIRLIDSQNVESLQIVDVLGHVVKTCRDGERSISTIGMPAGVYMLRIINGDEVKVQKIIIKN